MRTLLFSFFFLLNASQMMAQNCYADFYYDSTNCPSINFYNYSFVADSNDIISSTTWDFGDGNSSTAYNPSNSYSSDGTYTVCLTITTQNGCSSTMCQDVYVYCGNQSNCSAAFSYDSIACPTVAFYDYSSSGGSQISSYFWDFGDGNTSSSANPNNTYANAGWYDVCLSITTVDSCSSTYCQTIYVDCGGSSNDCQASINYSDSACPQIEFYGSAQSNSQIVSWEWTFGDGGNSFEQYPSYTYTNNGYYYVCLTVTSADSCVSTVCDTVYINCTSNINESSFGELLLSPNPANDYVSLSFENAMATSITIIDLNGSVLFQTSTSEMSEKIDVSNLSTGLYLVKIKRDNQIKTLRLIKN